MPEQPTDSQGPATPVPRRWSPLQRRLHWLVAGLLSMQALLSLPMSGAAEALEAVASGESAPRFLDWLVTTLHAANGTALGLLVVWRVALRRRTVSPQRARSLQLFHALLYALLLFMVCSGMLNWFAGVSVASRWHALGQWLLLAAVVLHLAGGLRHALRGDDVFRAMAGRSSGR